MKRLKASAQHSRCSSESHDGARPAVGLRIAGEVAELSDDVVQLLDVVGRRSLSHYTLQVESCILALLVDLARASEVSEQARSARRRGWGEQGDGRCTLSESVRYVEASSLTESGAERAAVQVEEVESEKRASRRRGRSEAVVRAEAAKEDLSSAGLRGSLKSK